MGTYTFAVSICIKGAGFGTKRGLGTKLEEITSLSAFETAKFKNNKSDDI
jgi:hypothetical protein